MNEGDTSEGIAGGLKKLGKSRNEVPLEPLVGNQLC